MYLLEAQRARRCHGVENIIGIDKEWNISFVICAIEITHQSTKTGVSAVRCEFLDLRRLITISRVHTKQLLYAARKTALPIDAENLLSTANNQYSIRFSGIITANRKMMSNNINIDGTKFAAVKLCYHFTNRNLNYVMPLRMHSCCAHLTASQHSMSFKLFAIDEFYVIEGIRTHLNANWMCECLNFSELCCKWTHVLWKYENENENKNEKLVFINWKT